MNADVVVVGAGIVGASIALQLARRDVGDVLLCRRGGPRRRHVRAQLPAGAYPLQQRGHHPAGAPRHRDPARLGRSRRRRRLRVRAGGVPARRGGRPGGRLRSQRRAGHQPGGAHRARPGRAAAGDRADAGRRWPGVRRMGTGQRPDRPGQGHAVGDGGRADVRGPDPVREPGAGAAHQRGQGHRPRHRRRRHPGRDGGAGGGAMGAPAAGPHRDRPGHAAAHAGAERAAARGRRGRAEHGGHPRALRPGRPL